MSLFSNEEIQDLTTKVFSDRPSCGKCGLSRDCKSPKMKATGNGKERILLLGDFNGTSEDENGFHFAGKAGRRMKRLLADNGVDMNEDCWKLNSVNCLANDKTGNKHIDYCRPLVYSEIKRLKPTVIFVLGEKALYSLFGDKWNLGDLNTMDRWRGWTIPYKKFGAWVCPMFHPDYLLMYEEKDEVIETVFRQDIRNALSCVCREFPEIKENVVLFADKSETVKFLTSLLNKVKPALTAFDYETSGLKPHASEHFIRSCAIAYGDASYAFMVDWGSAEVKELVKQYLVHPRIGKIAADLKFEERWSRQYFGVGRVTPWVWDTQLASHLEDNRRGITGLKFQMFVRYGVEDYASHLDKYLKSNGDSANDYNMIDKAPWRDLLKYNALDSLYELELVKLQMRSFGIVNPEQYARKVIHREST